MMKMDDCVLTALQGMRVRRGVPLSELTSFRIGGPAAVVVTPHSEAELCRALAACGQSNYPFRILGRGTNVLAPDEGFDGLIIRLDAPFFSPELSGHTLRCSAGERLSSIARFALSAGLAGLEGMEGIPGTVGGACAMNAGAFGAEMKSYLRRVRIYQDGEVFDVDVQDGDLGCRTSVFAAPAAIVLAAELALLPDDGTARVRMEEFARRRAEKQPLDLPSAGSVFKRPVGYYAGGLIEQCGLKGLCIGGAEVSKKHAGFIVNKGAATASDVAALIAEVQRRVFEETGVRLERELKFWNEV